MLVALFVRQYVSYRKPYDNSANIKLTYMKQTILGNITEPLTTNPTSHRSEVLFFADLSQNKKSQISSPYINTTTFEN
jgi:hypothetical protein